MFRSSDYSKPIKTGKLIAQYSWVAYSWYDVHNYTDGKNSITSALTAPALTGIIVGAVLGCLFLVFIIMITVIIIMWVVAEIMVYISGIYYIEL